MRQIVLPDGRVIVPNDEQISALNMLEEWAESPELFALLSGYAGTGKTTLTIEFIRHLKSRGVTSIAVTAPTHKAKREISSKTGLDGETIQKMLGFGIDSDVVNFDPNKPEFKPKYHAILPEFRYVILDETSMVNKELRKYLFDVARNSRTKILFLGDKAQLPPVNEIESEIFSTPDITYKFELTKVERQQGDNPLMGIYDKIRSNLKSPTDLFHKKTDVLESGEGIEFLKSKEFEKGVLEAYSSEDFRINPEHCKLLCWTNAEVALWNKIIRKTHMENTNPGVPIGVVAPGDLLMAYASRENYISNASEYVVKSAKLGSIEITYPNPKNPAENLVTDFTCILAESTDVDTGMPIQLRILNPRDKKAIAHWTELYYAFINAAKLSSKKWNDYFKFRGQVLLIDDVVRGFSSIKRDLDYAYAITVHKSQGSTYNNVFIVETDINKNRRNAERNQLKYVALSRPRKKASLLIY